MLSAVSPGEYVQCKCSYTHFAAVEQRCDIANRLGADTYFGNACEIHTHAQKSPGARVCTYSSAQLSSSP